jgi:FRG domain
MSEFAGIAEFLNFEAPLAGWRGQADVDWPLHSGAYRRIKAQSREWLPGARDTPDEELMVEYETRLLQQARLAGHGYAGGRSLSDLELMGLLQHHGAATRLLDFTENAFIAPGSRVVRTLTGLGSSLAST